MSNVFVTGATGVLGRRTVPQLIAAGHRVTAVARSDAAAAMLRASGATPVAVDLFDATAVAAVLPGHEVVAHLATSIPTGASAATKRGWRTNDRLRRDVSAVLARAAIDAGVTRYVQESITFPYEDGGDAWVDESAARSYFWGNSTSCDAEAAAGSVTAAGGVGVVLRFAMFMADDSAHMRTFVSMARRGVWGLFGADDGHISFVHVDDAAAAVVAAMRTPSGTYNVAEADPRPRGEHRLALAEVVGRDRLRPVPGAVQQMAGAGAASLARSHRISSARLLAESDWVPASRALDRWGHVS